MLVTESAKSVINILKLSLTHFVSNIVTKIDVIAEAWYDERLLTDNSSVEVIDFRNKI